MRDIAVTLAVFATLPFILKRPYIGVLVWAWLSLMNPHRLAYGFALTMPFAQIVAIVTLIGLFSSGEPKRFPWSREVIVLIFFIAWMILTTQFAVNPVAAGEHLEKVLKVQFMTFVMLLLINDRLKLELMVWVIVASLGIYGLKGGLFTIAKGGVYHVMGPSGTFIGGNNELGLAMLMAVPLMRYLQLQTPHKWLRLGLGALMALTIVAILGTQSRGALVGLIVVALMLTWKSRKPFITVLFLALVLPPAYQFMPESWHQRMGTIQTYEEDGSAMGRINAWHMAANMALERPLGGGFESFTPKMFALYAPLGDDVHDAHSIYFEVLGEHGYVGLVLFLLLWFFTWRSCTQAIRLVKRNQGEQWIADLSRMIQVSYAAYATGGAFLGLAYYDLPYMLMAMAVVLRVLAGQPTDILAETAPKPDDTRMPRSHGPKVFASTKKVE